MSPASSYREAMSIEARVTESSIGPPNIPECTAWSDTVTSTVATALPRRLAVTAGSPTFQLSESATTMTSALSFSL